MLCCVVLCVLPRANTSRTELCDRTLRTTRQLLNTTSYVDMFILFVGEMRKIRFYVPQIYEALWIRPAT